MEHGENLDIHEFLASLGKKAVTKATQGFSYSQSKQSKSSEIVFVEDTDEYVQLSTDSVIANREQNGFSVGGGWTARGLPSDAQTWKKEDSSTWKDSSQVGKKFGWEGIQEETQAGGWETNTSIDANLGWGEEKGSLDGLVKGAQEACSDGLGEEIKETSEGWRQGTGMNATADTGWGKAQEKGAKKPGSGFAWGCNEQREFKGSRNGWSNERDHSSCEITKGISAWEGWSQSNKELARSSEIETVCREKKNPPGKNERGSREEGNQNDYGWGEGKTTTEGRKEDKVHDHDGWGSVADTEDKKGSENRLDQNHDDGWGKDRKVTCSKGVENQDSAPGGWEGAPKEEASGWGKGKTPFTGLGRCNEKEGGSKDGRGFMTNKGSNGRWGGNKGVSDGWGNNDNNFPSHGSLKHKKGIAKEWGSSLQQQSNAGWADDKSCSARWGKKIEVSDTCGWDCDSHEEGASNGWGISSNEKHEDKSLSGEWRESGDWRKQGQEKGASVGIGRNALKKTIGGWGKGNLDAVDVWQGDGKTTQGEERDPCQQTADGWREDQGAFRKWGRSINKGNDGGWGEGKTPPTGRGKCNQKEEGIKNEWGGSINEGNDCAWGGNKGASDGWGTDISASAGINRSSKAAGATYGSEKSVLGKSQSGLEHNKHFPEGQEGGLQQESNAGCGVDKNCSVGWEKVPELSVFNGWECDTYGGDALDGWGKSSNKTHEDKGLSGGWRESGDWGKHSQTKDASVGTGSNVLNRTNSGWGEKNFDFVDQRRGEKKTASGRWGQSNQSSTSGYWGTKNSDPGRWRGDASKERSAAGGGWGQDNNSGWCQKTKVTSKGWGQSSQQDNDEKKGGMFVKTDFSLGNDGKGWKDKKAAGVGWEKDTHHETNDRWGGEHGFATHDGWETGGQKVVDNGWFKGSDKNADTGWEDNRAVGICRSEGMTSEIGKGTQMKRASSGWGEESSLSGERRTVGSVAYTSWENDKEGQAQNKTAETDKAKEDAGGGWEQTTPWTTVAGWEGIANDDLHTHEKTDATSSWGHKRKSSTMGNWQERGEGSTCGWSNINEKGTRIGQGNKSSACSWNNRNSKKEESNIGWRGLIPAGSTSGGWGESKHLGTSNKWGDCSQNISNPGWGSSHDTIANGDKLTQSTLEDGSSGGHSGAGDDTCGWNHTSQKDSGWETGKEAWNHMCEKGSGWGTGMEGWKPQSQRSTHTGGNAGQLSENFAADERRSGNFGPSGSNCVPLGKRKGSETNDWKQPVNNWTSSQLSYQGSQQDQRQWAGKRFNNGYSGTPRRSFASCGSQIHTRRPRLLKTLISLPEYSEMDELYKATNRVLHHSGYQAGDRLNSEDENFILEKVLAHHQEKDTKLGCGLDHFMIDYHADHQVSCFWIVRADGSKVDFSYWKCLEHLFEVKYPHVLREAQEEESKDGFAAASHESPQAKEEINDWETPNEKVVTEEKVTQQVDDDGW